MPTIKKPNQYFDATTYTGNGGTLSVTNTGGFQPDMVWVKSRSNSGTNNLITDVARGNRGLFTNLTEGDSTGRYCTLLSNGFQFVGTAGDDGNTSGWTYVGWQWKAGGASTVNTSGSISSNVSVNTTSGFSIVTYTGNSTDNTNYTVGHGLGVKPAMIIVKNRDWAASTGAWVVWHQSQSTSLGYLNGNYAFDSSDFGYFMGSTQPTNSLFTVRSDTVVSTVNRYRTNGGGSYKYVAYCWAEIAGFSKFGSYTGNGSTDGPFVYLGFRPKFVMIKVISTTGSWVVLDSSRGSYNVNNLSIYPDLSAAEESGVMGADFLSNGFKLRYTPTEVNGSGATYIYAAFAEAPFKFSNAR